MPHERPAALDARLTDLFALTASRRATVADVAELNRSATALQGALTEDVVLDPQQMDDWYAHMERTDPFMQPED